MNAKTDDSHGAVAGQVERSVRSHALAEALRGIADGFDQQRPWLRPDPLVMSTLRRAADELDKAGDALAAERERRVRAENEVADAKHAMRAYARERPRHEYRGLMQDPNGVHGWLARNDGPNARVQPPTEAKP